MLNRAKKGGLIKQTQFNIHQAETHLPQLIEQLEPGGEAVITRAGVRLVRIAERPPHRTLVRLQGPFKLPSTEGLPIPPTPDEFLDAIEGDGCAFQPTPTSCCGL